MSTKFKLIFTIILALTTIYSVDAQEDKKSKKVIIIKKTDDNGKVSETRTETEGADVDALLKSLSPDDIRSIDIEKDQDNKKVIKITKNIMDKELNSDDNKNMIKEIEISKDETNGKSITKYKVINKNGDQEKVIEWYGDGPMPEELVKELESIDFVKKGNHIKFFIDDDKEDDIVIMDSQEKKRDQIMGWNDHKGRIFFPERRKVRDFNFRKENQNNNKVSLGVMIEDTDNGVIITDIVKGSAAEYAGLRRGDVLLKINNNYVFNSNSLLESLNPFNPNEKVKIRYIRDGKEKSTKAVLKAKN